MHRWKANVVSGTAGRTPGRGCAGRSRELARQVSKSAPEGASKSVALHTHRVLQQALALLPRTSGAVASSVRAERMPPATTAEEAGASRWRLLRRDKLARLRFTSRNLMR